MNTKLCSRCGEWTKENIEVQLRDYLKKPSEMLVGTYWVCSKCLKEVIHELERSYP